MANLDVNQSLNNGNDCPSQKMRSDSFDCSETGGKFAVGKCSFIYLLIFLISYLRYRKEQYLIRYFTVFK